jgi:hypothetical protein
MTNQGVLSRRQFLMSLCITAIGLDIATVAKLAGNNSDTIMKHYFAAKTHNLVLPEF